MIFWNGEPFVDASLKCPMLFWSHDKEVCGREDRRTSLRTPATSLLTGPFDADLMILH